MQSLYLWLFKEHKYLLNDITLYIQEHPKTKLVDALKQVDEEVHKEWMTLQ